jgi:hypothetical protein
MLINCNTKTLEFFNNVLIDLINTRGWDQVIINKHLKYDNNNLTISIFDKTKIYCGLDFDHSYKYTYLIYKSFIFHSSNIINNFNKRLDTFKKFELITDDEYNANYKHE